MARRIVIGGAVLALNLTAVIALPLWRAQGQDPAQQESAAEKPFAALDHLVDEATTGFGFNDQATGRDQDYLRLSPQIGSQDVPKALTENVPYSSCERAPEVSSKAFAEPSFDAYARRMIYSYAQMRRVLNTRDCSCAGKVAPFSDVAAIEGQVAERDGHEWNRRVVGREYITLARGLRSQVEAMCGGEF
ncbi:hypothetical protein [Paracoccus ravus]|uniref:hypothetical protein n=1 Tax=Paracoccus ravus TaxID=2447760 RepID=UPI00106ED5F8|nr:hypothetical protein [Paracoccus ravus]